jgi:hypothetical protein
VTVPRGILREFPDPLPLSAAGAVIAGVAAIRWTGFLSMAVTLALLGFVALLVRWADAGRRQGDPPRIAIAACAAVLGGPVSALLLPRPWVGLSFALAFLVALAFGAPGHGPRGDR